MLLAFETAAQPPMARQPRHLRGGKRANYARLGHVCVFDEHSSKLAALAVERLGRLGHMETSSWISWPREPSGGNKGGALNRTGIFQGNEIPGYLGNDAGAHFEEDSRNKQVVHAARYIEGPGVEMGPRRTLNKSDEVSQSRSCMLRCLALVAARSRMTSL